MAKPSVQWKQMERYVAKVFGGERRGAYTGGTEGGRSDIIHPHFSIEVKLLGSPGYADLLAACRQSEDNADSELHEPLAVVKRKGRRLEDTLVVQRLPTFAAWRLGDVEK